MTQAWPAWLPAFIAATALVAGVGTGLARRYALRRGLVDAPGERRSHLLPTPRGGGVAVVVAWLPALAGWAWAAPGAAVAATLVATGTLLVAAVGWIDDHRPLSPWLRLAVHALAAALLAAAAWSLAGDALLALAAFVLGMVLVNAWNFMDGIDGLAASQAVIVAAAYGAVAGGAAGLVGLALAAACAGFLPWNFPRARIFLGDVGSGALGHALAALAVLAAAARPEPAGWPLLLLPPLAMLVDTALTLLRRMVRGERWWTPHVSHAYQRLARRAGRHWPVTAAYAVFTAVLSVVAVAGLLGSRMPLAFNMALLLTAGLCAGWAWMAAGTGEAADRDSPTR